MFAVQHSQVEPDILVMAKGIASGLPLSGIIARRELLATWAPGTHGGTYGGNVVACAAALATLDVIEQEGLVENAAERGLQMLSGLRAITAGRREVGDVRGIGLMLALEFVKPDEGDGRVPNPDAVKRVIGEAADRRLLLLSAGSYGQVIRIIPPLVTTAAEVDHALEIISASLDAAGVNRN
jgi:4-aminobutyrate aminotransferase